MITRHNEELPTWYPTSVGRYESLLSKAIERTEGYNHSYALKKNIAYNLQYYEYLVQTLKDLRLHSVIMKQTYKSIILTGSGIVESILHYLIIKRKIQKTSEWELKYIMQGNPKKIDDVFSKADTHIFTKLSKPINLVMTYDAMLKKSKEKKVLGVGHKVYNKLEQLRHLRNKVHLQAIDSHYDTDWNSFNKSDFEKMSEVLYLVLTNKIFEPTLEEKNFLKYLKIETSS